MFNLKMKVYEMRYNYYSNQKKRWLKKAEKFLNNHDFNGYEKCMNRSRYYMAKIVHVSKKREDLELN